MKSYYERNKAKIKQYYLDHKAEYYERSRKWANKNKELVSQRARESYLSKLTPKQQAKALAKAQAIVEALERK